MECPRRTCRDGDRLTRQPVGGMTGRRPNPDALRRRSMNWLAAIVIGVVIGVIAAVFLGRRSARARWMAPLLSIVGALIGAGLGAAFGHSGYGWKKAALEIVLAIVG